MSGDELLAAFADDGSSLGAFPRDEIHRLGHWHEVFHCLVVAYRDGEPFAVLQRRSASKRAFPGLLDLSAGGHILADESLEEGVRELHEELGITPTLAELVPLGTFRIADEDPAAEGNNREIVHSYLFLDDRPLDSYDPDPVELDGVAEVSLDDLQRLYTEPGALAEVTELPLDGPQRTYLATAGDLVPDIDNYWPSMLKAVVSHLKPLH